MAALSDRDIKQAIEDGEITVDPLFPDSIQSASVDVHLGRQFRVFKQGFEPVLDLAQPIDNHMSLHTINEDRPYILPVNSGVVLGITFETVGVKNKHRAQIEGKSSLGRAGLVVHVTAGYIDPGFCNRITLELVNLSGKPIPLYYGMPIAQIAFEELKSPAERAYGSAGLGSKYVQASDAGPQASQYFKNFLPPSNTWMEFRKNFPDR